MRRYANSRFRLFLLIAIAALIVFAAHKGFAQTGSANAPTSSNVTQRSSFSLVFSLIAENFDPIFVVIVILSITGVTLIIQGFIQNRRAAFMPIETTNLMRDMISQRRFRDLLEYSETDPGFVSQAMNHALKRAPNFDAMKEAMETSVSEQTAERFRKIEYLNIIGNLGPLLGLLGTVLGMIDAFERMKMAGGSYKPADLAGGISMALCHTFLGLVLAIPCLAAFGVLRTMVDRLTTRGALEAEELLLMIRPAAPGAPPPPAAAHAINRPLVAPPVPPPLSHPGPAEAVAPLAPQS
ncbi:MAG TPA: MotA/TolQ/ExbB proton channel family protein [Tepidisphaeraceae bacterium]|nr:MotA/TolQ/ExbB proton channel family protein [Tepidisphaeraceae bacterium]